MKPRGKIIEPHGNKGKKFLFPLPPFKKKKTRLFMSAC
jgi:hypothetical protein